ncbi:MAG: tetratricopeptide repeat protein [Candidatus Sericytochromatia bacterium]|nr:tetratricopeptide repeat protein [Candidatus Sericytochromatia bacterium]
MTIINPLADANTLLAAGRWAEAEAVLAEAARGGQAEAALALGRLALQRGAWAQAAAWLTQAREGATDPSAGAFELAWCQLKLGRAREAEALLADLPPGPAALHLLGRARLEVGRGPEARAPLQACGLPAADLELGWAHWLADEPREASRAWQRWLRAGAADWGTKDALATWLFLRTGGPQPDGRPERPAEPVRHLSDWLRWLLRHGRRADVEAAWQRGPRLHRGLWEALRPSWEAVLEAEGADPRGRQPGP